MDLVLEVRQHMLQMLVVVPHHEFACKVLLVRSTERGDGHVHCAEAESLHETTGAETFMLEHGTGLVGRLGRSYWMKMVPNDLGPPLCAGCELWLWQHLSGPESQGFCDWRLEAQ